VHELSRRYWRSGTYGQSTARELVEMPEAEWGILRDRITDYRQGRPAGVVCRCVMCGEPEWQIPEHLVPEIFHRRVREQLRYLSKLPPWAEHEDLPNPSYEPGSLAI
jgi:hypothetical protein